MKYDTKSILNQPKAVSAFGESFLQYCSQDVQQRIVSQKLVHLQTVE